MRLEYVLKDVSVAGYRYDGCVVGIKGVEYSVVGGFRYVIDV